MVNDGEFDSNTFSLSVTVESVDDAPIINSSTSQSVDEDASLTMSIGMLSVDDIDTDSASLTMQIMAGDNYTINGAIVTPETNFNGSLLVNVKVNDGTSDSNSHQVVVTVNPVNDNPTAVDDTFTVEENSSAASFAVLANDSDIDGDSLTIETVNYSGGGTLTNQGGNLSYTPGNNFDGTESLTYTVSDGHGGTAIATVTITVTAKPSSGGSMPLLFIFAMIPFVIIRRVK
jgi:hypothetical protein